MRYLIAETSWPLMALAAELSRAGVLLTRTDRPQDVPHYLRFGPTDLLILASADLADARLSLPALRRAWPAMPVALMAEAANPEQVAHWLEAGADTVLNPAAPPEETAMMLSAVARRVHGLSRPEKRYGPLCIDLNRRIAHLHETPLGLSPKLYELLEFMALRPGRLLGRTTLLTHLYGLENAPDPRVFDVYICNLRACLGPAEGAVDIETVRGGGYRFIPPAGGDSAAA